MIQADESGETSFVVREIEDQEVQFGPPPNPTGLRTDFGAVESMFAFSVPAGTDVPAHNAPKPYICVVLWGEGEVLTSDGDKRALGPGDVLFCDDLTGKGTCIAHDNAVERFLSSRGTGLPTIEIPQNMKIPTASANDERGNNVAAVTVVEITDPTAAGEGIEVIDQDVVQLQSNPLRVTRVVVRFCRTLVVYQSTNLPVRARTRVSLDLIAFVAFGPNAEGTFNGVALRPDLLLAAEPGIAGEFVVGAGYESVSVFLPPADLREHLDIRQRENEFRYPHGIEMLQSSTSAARNLFDWGKSVAEIATQQPELFDDHATSRATAHIELMEMLLAALGSSKEHEPTRSDRTMQTHSRIVHVAEDYATTHTEERVSVTDLCEASDVSERTLQYAFQKIMGMTPVAYLTRLRLHRVRQALRNSSHGTTTVSAEALRWGFWHFGDFSRAYKKFFGEPPSDTLKQARH